MDKYVITDPAYLITDSDWGKVIKQIKHQTKPDDKNFTQIFNQAFTDFFKQFSNQVIVKATGYGDWANEMHTTSKTATINGFQFVADTGSVIVIKSNKQLLDYLKHNLNRDLTQLINQGLAQSVTVSELVTIHVNTNNPTWTVIKLLDENSNLIAHSELNEPEY